MQLVEKKVLKVNQSLDSISVIAGVDDVMAGPTIYVQEFYHFYNDIADGDFERTVDQAVTLIMRGLLAITIQSVSQKVDAELLKDKPIIPQVINAEKNKELLTTVPHRMVEGLDLAVVYRILVDVDEDGYASTIITNEIADELGKTEEELHHKSNDTVINILPCEINYISDDFCSVTNERKIAGAYYGFDKEVLAMVSSKMNNDLYILPSSLHECFILSANYNDEEYIKSAIIDANTSVVPDDEFLSNNLYMYLRNENKVVIV